MGISDSFALFPTDPFFTIIFFYLSPLIFSIIGFFVSYRLYKNVQSKPKELFIIAFSLLENKTFEEMKIITILILILLINIIFIVFGSLLNNVFFLKITAVLTIVFGVGMIYIITEWNKRIEKIGKKWK
ncbi:MAG: hypothetical protein QXT34_02565 [Candidatus Aenigmatarchaeota archaeon]